MSQDDDPERPYGYVQWRDDGFPRRPPWRRGYQLEYLAISLVLFLGLLAGFLLAASGRL